MHCKSIRFGQQAFGLSVERNIIMAKYRDFDDDYEYDDEQYIYEDAPRGKKSRITEESMHEENRKPRKKKKRKRWVMILVFVIEIILLLVLLAVWYVVGKLEMIERPAIDRDAIVINKELDDDTKEVLEGYTNILLLGSDARDNSAEGLNKIGENHTDAIIVASINNKTKEVRLVSIYRDTVLKIVDTANTQEVMYNKATDAMFFYGVEAAISMVNTNFDLDIEDYVMVNWNALIEIIDAVGGIDLEIDDNELYWINEYLRDTGENTGRTYENVPNSGYVHLDGIQATAYCRIRYGGGNDFRRTERQRTVINLVVEKAKEMDITKLNGAINSVFGNISTSLDVGEILNLAKSIASYSITESVGVPSEVAYVEYLQGNTKDKDFVVANDLTAAVAELHKVLFDVDNYEPTATVKEINSKISELSGAY